MRDLLQHIYKLETKLNQRIPQVLAVTSELGQLKDFLYWLQLRSVNFNSPSLDHRTSWLKKFEPPSFPSAFLIISEKKI